MKISIFILLILSFSSCVVSRKKYLALEKELTQLKTDLKDDDHDGVANYLDLEQNTDTIAQVDNKGRTIKVIKIIDMDEDGILDVNDFCPTIKGIASANGCPDRDGDGVYDFEDKCPRVAGPDSTYGCPTVTPIIDVRTVPITYGIRFVGKTTNYKPKTKNLLDTLLTQVSEEMLKNSNYIIEIRSYTDSLGDSLKNIALCEKRGELIKIGLVKKGVPQDRLLIKALGSQNPKNSNETKEGRESNNRIEFFVIIKDD